jgi:arginase
VRSRPWTFQQEKGLGWLNPDQPVTGSVHIHFDLDALDPAEFPLVPYPDGNMPMAAGLSLVRAVGSSGKLVGLTITEFVRPDDVAAEYGSVLLHRLCEASLAPALKVVPERCELSR